MPSLWIQHVKNYARQYNITYKESLKLAKPSYSKFGTVITEPSQIKLKLNDEQYNLNTVAIKPTFKKGSTETHIVNIKYNSDEAIKIPPNPLVENIPIEEQIPPNPLEQIPPNPLEPITPIYSELAEPIYSPFGDVKPKKILNYQMLNQQYQKPKQQNNAIIKINQQKIYNPYQKPKQQNNFKEEEEEENNIYNVEGIIKPSKKYNSKQYKNEINKINAKMNKIKNTDMSKYLNKPITPKPTPKKNEYFDFLNEPPKPQFERLPKDHIYYDILTPYGVIPFDFIETPEFKGRDDQINFLNKLLKQHENLIIVLSKGKLPEDETQKLKAECNANIYKIENIMEQIKELKELENIEINKIEQNKKHYDTNIKALKSKFETQKHQRETSQNKKHYDTNIKALKSQFEAQKQQRETSQNKKN